MDSEIFTKLSVLFRDGENVFLHHRKFEHVPKNNLEAFQQEISSSNHRCSRDIR